ncbi:cell division protein FtsK, partial [Enterococcus hirae]
MKKLIQYRGRRIRYSSRNLLNFYKFFLLSPVLVLLGYFVGYKQIYLLVIKSVQKWQVYVLPVVFIMACLIGSLLLINLLIKWSIIRSGYFSK